MTARRPRPRLPKTVGKPALQITPDARALGLSSDSAGGFAVPFQLDGKVKKTDKKPTDRDDAA